LDSLNSESPIQKCDSFEELEIKEHGDEKRIVIDFGM